jgi:hypothetical protein
VRPARPELTGAPRYTAMVLRFRWFFFLRNRGGMGSHLGNPRQATVNEKGRMTAVELDFGGGGSWFHQLDGAENWQNGGGDACRRSSGC